MAVYSFKFELRAGERLIISQNWTLSSCGFENEDLRGTVQPKDNIVRSQLFYFS